ncbi:serine hydrolase domain-containing protein [Flavihumibacter petaseus]|uniref:Beta-lactamase-related domain-containing protein n=1 Tax=Flavihumibacter petaseus NBRC 106054 TaxID=1220578 RepID=A0A0E9MVX4_9BACT|nr:serine hydrolase domain-containing protein [Flavihumibacter petaseus]GAO41744.1 hypothetical protein FPE01S_01_07580 [Flavihumibacter petaseus NBRC 106054]
MSIRIVITVLFGWLLTSASAQTKKTLQQADSLLLANYPKNEPGVAVAMISGGHIVFSKGYGLASLETRQPIDPKTVFNIASLTKEFTATAIRKLAAEGKLRLEDTIGRYISGLAPAIGSQVTIKAMLSHGSGMTDHYGFVDTTGIKHATDADVLAAVKKTDSLYFSPGTAFRYSNTAYCLLALVVEKVTGQSFAGYMQQALLLPAGMKHSFVWQPGSQLNPAATGYDLSENKTWVPSGPQENRFFSTEGDGGLYTNTEDYAQWFEHTIRRQPIAIQQPITAKPHMGYGFGWFIDERDKPVSIYHSGSNGGFRSYVFAQPDAGFMLVLFSNRADKDIEQTAFGLLKLVLSAKKDLVPIQYLTN